MKKIKLLGLVAILAITVEGCSVISEFFTSGDRENTTPKSSSVEAVDNLSTQKQSIESQLENELATPTPQRVSGLIPATNPNVRVSGSIRGRQDPFALVDIEPKIEIEPEQIEEDPDNAPQSKVANNESGVPTIDSLDNQGKNSESLPTLAEQVIITGIVKLGSMTKIIVKAPEEAYTRHVGIGEYLSNGQVLVKRIEGLDSPSPKIVLEQKGVEVSKQVGELPLTEEESETRALGIKGLDNQHLAIPLGQSLNTSKTWLPNFLSKKLKYSKNN